MIKAILISLAIRYLKKVSDGLTNRKYKEAGVNYIKLMSSLIFFIATM